jgi:hypothetical protein
MMTMFQRSPLRCRGCSRRFHRRIDKQALEDRSTRQPVANTDDVPDANAS